MKVIEQYFHMVLFIMLYNVVSTRLILSAWALIEKNLATQNVDRKNTNLQLVQ